MYKTIIKPFLDFIAALLVLLLVSPIFLFVLIGLYIANNGKPFFLQPRPGKNGKIFTIIKFKTMNDKKDVFGKLLPDSDRLTRVGAFVRKTSLDELPQLFNVLKGEMSLVGPRPLLTQYMHLYSPYQNRRHEVRPGITGWAQVNGRNAIDWPAKFDLDVWYVEHVSLLLDVKIIMKTIQKVFLSEGINSTDSVSAEPFRGCNTVLVIGAGGHAKVVVDCLEAEGKYSIQEVLDDAPVATFIGAYTVQKRNIASDYQKENVIVAIGNQSHRKAIVQQLAAHFIMTIHPTSVVSKYAKLGAGTQIFANAVINAGAVIGEHCIINTGAIVEHDCVIGDFVHVAPSATLGGGVHVGPSTHVGMGAVVLQNVVIGKNVIIGAGAVVIKDLPDNCTALGVPAKPVSFRLEKE